MGAIEFNRLDVLKQLLLELQQSGQDVAAALNCSGKLMASSHRLPKDHNCTPLTAAALLGHAELATFLIGPGAQPDQMNSDGLTALMYAAGWGHITTVHALLAAGAGVDYPSGRECATPLMFAALNGHTTVVQALLERGARLDQAASDEDPTRSGCTALMLAAGQGHTATVQALLQAGARVDRSRALGLANLLQHEEVIKLLHAHSADSST